jgi:hypothetical protein
VSLDLGLVIEVPPGRLVVKEWAWYARAAIIRCPVCQAAIAERCHALPPAPAGYLARGHRGRWRALHGLEAARKAL